MAANSGDHGGNSCTARQQHLSLEYTTEAGMEQANTLDQREEYQETPVCNDSLQLFTNQSIARRVRDDIKTMLANSWELQQLNKTAPKVAQSTLNHLALPKRARIQQQVTHSLHDVSDFAKWKAAQLAKQRHAALQADLKGQQCKQVQKEALQGWHREKEQLGRQLHLQHQQQLEKEKQVAKINATLATQQAKADLQGLKEKLQRQQLHAAELKRQLINSRMNTSMR